MSIIYNEGRIVGYSAYESYLKTFKARVPTGIPLTEQEWLASSLGSGASLIVKLTGGAYDESTNPNGWKPLRYHPQGNLVTGKYFQDVRLPSGTSLCGASTLHASLFIGNSVYDSGARFPKAVNSYGPGIQNTSTFPMSQTGHGSLVQTPYQDDSKLRWDTSFAGMSNFIHIIDALAFQPGTRIASTVHTSGKPYSPYDVIRPDFTKPGLIRFIADEIVEGDVQILITGFLNSSAIIGEASWDETNSKVSTSEGDHPENGDFLGPECFPWACKIILCFPNACVSSLVEDTVAAAMAEAKTEGFAKAIKNSVGSWNGAYVQAYSPLDNPNQFVLNVKPYAEFEINVPVTKILKTTQSGTHNERLYFYHTTKSGDAVTTDTYTVWPIPSTVPSDSSEERIGEYVTWNELIIDLYNDQKLDILGAALRGAKSVNFTAGDNYIQIEPTSGTPVRLYFGSSAPTPANLPTGCLVLGIGW